MFSAERSGHVFWLTFYGRKASAAKYIVSQEVHPDEGLELKYTCRVASVEEQASEVMADKRVPCVDESLLRPFLKDCDLRTEWSHTQYLKIAFSIGKTLF